MRNFLIISFFLLPFSLVSGVDESVPLLITDSQKIAAIQPRDALCIIGAHRKRVKSADLLDAHILHIEKYESDDAIILSTRSGSVAVSSHQLFFNTDRNEWTKAGNIKTGEHYFSVKSPRSKIINTQKVKGLSKLFELSLSYPHVFFIGKAIGLLTHNKPMHNLLTFFGNYAESSASNVISNMFATTAVTSATIGGANAFYRWMNNDTSSRYTVSDEEAQRRVEEQDRYHEQKKMKRLQEQQEKFLQEVEAFKKEELDFEKSRGFVQSFNNYDTSTPSALKYSKKRFKEKKKSLENENRRRQKFEEKMKKNKKPDPEKEKIDKNAVIVTAIVDRIQEEVGDIIENAALDEAADLIDEKTNTSYASTANKVYQGVKAIKTLKSDMDKFDNKTLNVGDVIMGANNIKGGIDLVKDNLPERKEETVALTKEDKIALYNMAMESNRMIADIIHGSSSSSYGYGSSYCSDYRLSLIRDMSTSLSPLSQSDWKLINRFAPS